MRARGALGVLVASLLATATPAGAQIPKTVETPYAAPSDQALLVFSRPRRRQASETTYRIVNQAGRCIAVLNNGWQMAAPMWPGKHMLMVITGTAPPTAGQAKRWEDLCRQPTLARQRQEPGRDRGGQAERAAPRSVSTRGPRARPE
ncbi:MAG: hypothetical protein EP303_01220 [Deltaproteobacteria bacterium]|nr:MAG: hypothetical protein EP303_01220 [Deltaproteobacteria bacterium]